MPSRQSFAGILIFVMIVLSIIDGIWGEHLPVNLLWPGGLAGWIAAILLISNIPHILRIQVSILLITGICLLIFAASKGAQINLLKTLTSNTALLSMIAAVGFLRLVALPNTEVRDDLPKGKMAFFKTLIGVSVFSSFINISAPILIADRIHQHIPLNRLTAQSIIRVFCSAASWSPFFAAMAVILTYSPGSELTWLMLAGLPFAMIGLGLVTLEGLFRYGNRLATFVGYPMKANSLGVPAILVFAVMTGTFVLDNVSTLTVISLSALLVTTTMLIWRRGLVNAKTDMGLFVIEGLPRIVNELILFLSAGVLAAGITELIQNGFIDSPFSIFDVTTAIQLLGFMIIFSAIGIHPVIQITSLSPMIIPLNPDPNLLAITYLFAWHLGTCASPLSGTNLVFQGRYNIPSWKLAIWNWPYSIAMYLVAIVWLPFISAI